MAPPLLHSKSTSHARSRNSRKGQELDRNPGKREAKMNNPVPNRSASFHGRNQAEIPHPKTQPELLSGRRSAPDEEATTSEGRIRVPNKVLINVNVQASLLGPLPVLASTEWSVYQLVDAAIRSYAKEGRRPPLPTVDPLAFGLHYSQFSLEALDQNEKLIELGSRNFFLCPKAVNPAAVAAKTSSFSSAACSDQVGKASVIDGIPWLRFFENILL